MDLELLDLGDDDELMFFMEALHEGHDAPGGPRLRVAMHQIVARQILADGPPRRGRPCGSCPDCATTGTIMHMIAGLIAEDVYAAMAEPDQLASSRRATTQNDTRRPDRRLGAADARAELVSCLAQIVRLGIWS